MKYSPAMFDQVCKAVANVRENWQEDGEGNAELIWNFVDSDVFAYFKPERDEVEAHYEAFDAACAALEAARGEPFPRSKY